MSDDVEMRFDGPDARLHPAGAGRARWAASSGARPPFPTELLRAAARADLPEHEAALAWELGRLARGLDHAERVTLALAVLALRDAVMKGSTILPLRGAGGLRDTLSTFGATEARAKEVVSLVRSAGRRPARFSPIVGPAPAEGVSPSPLIFVDRFLAAERDFAMESRVGAALREREARGAALDPARVDAALDDVIAIPPVSGGTPLKLSKEQREAIRAAATGAVTFVSGGPGTGKTSIVVSLLRVLVRLFGAPDAAVGPRGLDDIVLTAPTGKAADRMRGAVASALNALRAPGFDDRVLMAEVPRARTLHRLLGYSPASGRFRHHERNHLAARVVIVDEASMIDLAMMDRLLRALAPEAQLILLGDADQLPSVDAGAVFRDVCARKDGNVRALKKSFRMDPRDPNGSHILHVARAINRGKVDALLPAENAEEKSALRRRGGLTDVTFAGVEWLPAADDETRAEVLRLWRRQHIDSLPDRDALLGRAYVVRDGALTEDTVAPLRRIFTHLFASKVLCVTRSRPTGVLASNRLFHRAHPSRKGPPGRIAWGEPVLVHRNDYQRGLFNGDQGVVLGARVDDDPKPRSVVVFARDAGFVAFPVGAIRHLIELSYAMTVHKSQGSEYDRVAILLPEAPIPLLTREILYTAVTRAKQGVLIVGGETSLRHGVESRVDRHSRLRK